MVPLYRNLIMQMMQEVEEHQYNKVALLSKPVPRSINTNTTIAVKFLLLTATGVRILTTQVTRLPGKVSPMPMITSETELVQVGTTKKQPTRPIT